jgi:hypothetical protein
MLLRAFASFPARKEKRAFLAREVQRVLFMPIDEPARHPPALFEVDVPRKLFQRVL